MLSTMKKSKANSQSSQQTTLTSFFKTNSSKQHVEVVNSQNTSGARYSSILSSGESSSIRIKSPDKRNDSKSVGASESKYCNNKKSPSKVGTGFFSRSPVKSPSKSHTLLTNKKINFDVSKITLNSLCKLSDSNCHFDQNEAKRTTEIRRHTLKCEKSNKVSKMLIKKKTILASEKSGTVMCVKSPEKLIKVKNTSPSKSLVSNLIDILSPSKKNKLSNSIRIDSLSGSCDVDDIGDTVNALKLRRSPRKHPPSKTDVEYRSKVNEEIKNDESSDYKPCTISVDEPDDGFIDEIQPDVINAKFKTSNQWRKRSAESSDGSFEYRPKKRQIIQSAARNKSPSKVTAVSLNDDLLDSEDLSFFSDLPDLQSPNVVDLSKGCRCKILQVEHKPEGDIMLTLKCLLSDSHIRCLLRFPWCNLIVKEGDVVSVKASMAENCEWEVSLKAGTWFVIHSDMLISCTTVVGSLFCPRRSVLNHMFKELPTVSQASAMYVGIIIHQLLQQALKNKLNEKDQIEELYQKLLKSQDFIKTIFLQGMDLENIKETASKYLPKIIEFIHSYISIDGQCKGSNPKEWPGLITSVNDIEENLWIPQLGLKGKIDATVQVKIHSKTKVMPLELKTGKPSNSAEHRGQVILYCMMLNIIGEESADSGLLLYLRDGSVKDVFGGEKERRHLIMLRNELSSRIRMAYLSSEQHGLPSLPSPIDRLSVCKTCPQLITCTSVLRKSGENHDPLSTLIPESTSHLSDQHLDYVFSWLQLLSLEVSHSKHSNPIWADSVTIRENEGSCISDLSIEQVIMKNGMKVEITFTREKTIQEGILEENEYVIVSNDNQVAVATGHVASVSSKHLTLLTDRDVSKLPGPFHIDRYESSGSNSLLTSFLSILLDNTDKSRSLRTTIIDKQLPKFSAKLSSKIKKMGEKVFATINRDQVRAILQVLSADTFIIIKGMPGTGKSRTVSALIELLTLLGHSILLTSHTHSAVDNILMKLPVRLHENVIRLGHSKRVNPAISHLTEESLLASSSHITHQHISTLYNSKTIVGVTCLGAMHQLILRREFDYCIVDEATQVCQPETLAALSAAKKFVLIGDPYQLPPLVISEKAKKLGMGISLLERLDKPAVTTSLSLQYRMNQTITSLANHFTYDNQLKCANPDIALATIQHKGVAVLPEWLIKVCCCKLSSSVIVIDVSTPHQSTNNISNKEIDIILSTVAAMKQIGICEKDIGVMSPYRAQVSLAAKELSLRFNEVEVSTVDQYQGRDKSVIFYSATRNKQMVAGSTDILGDKNRLTVAITRAKHKLIIIGNVTALSSYPTFKSLFSLIDPSCFVQPTTQ